MNATGRMIVGCAVTMIVATLPAAGGKLGSFEGSVGGSGSYSGSSSGNSGTLSSFESGTTSQDGDSSSSGVGHSYYYDSCWYCRYHHRCLFHDAYFWHGYGPYPPRAHVVPSPGDTNEMTRVEFEPVPGSPLLPLARLDLVWQSVEEDVEALDYALELGYSAVAVRGRFTRYEEDNPGDTLDLSSLLLLWRIPMARDIEADAGVGGAELAGNDTQSGLNVSLAVRGWIPHRRLGFEYRGEFMDIGNGINSNDLSLLLHLKAFAIRCGYRWVHTTGNSLDGPFVGAALSF